VSAAEYRHSFKGPIEGYVVNFLIRDLWKLEPTYGFHDSLNEAWVVFDRVAKTYPDVEDKHFMALFKRAWANRVIDMAKKATRQREEIPVHEIVAESVGDRHNSGYLQVLIKQMPHELASVIRLFLSAPEELLSQVTGTRRSTKKRQISNAMVSTWLGLPAGSQPIDDVEDYFTK